MLTSNGYGSKDISGGEASAQLSQGPERQHGEHLIPGRRREAAQRKQQDEFGVQCIHEAPLRGSR
jgi:hypothetical protein